MSAKRAAMSDDGLAVGDNRAVMSQNRAVVSETRAVASENRAVASETRAVTSENRAVASENRAVLCEDRALPRYDRAAIRANRAVLRQSRDFVCDDEEVIAQGTRASRSTMGLPIDEEVPNARKDGFPGPHSFTSSDDKHGPPPFANPAMRASMNPYGAYPIECGTYARTSEINDYKMESDVIDEGEGQSVAPGGELCVAGACSCVSPSSRCFDGRCVDTMSDPNNCGGCGYGCAVFDPEAGLIPVSSSGMLTPPPSQRCNLGVCSPACEVGLTTCGEACVDARTDPANCDRRGNVCGDGASCSAGQCTCSNPSLTYCEGQCVDTQSSALDCGGCGSKCPPGVGCAAGACQTSCTPPLVRCGADCVDLETSKDHCGLCEVQCGGTLVCTSGQCTCPTGTAGDAGICL